MTRAEMSATVAYLEEHAVGLASWSRAEIAGHDGGESKRACPLQTRRLWARSGL